MSNKVGTGIVLTLSFVFALAACDEKKQEVPAALSENGATGAAEKPMAKAAQPAAEAPAAAPAVAEEKKEAAAPVEMRLEEVKVAKGKVDKAQETLEKGLAALSTKCFEPAAKKEGAALDGTLALAMELDAAGKVSKLTMTPSGKVPEELSSCIKQELESSPAGAFDTSKAIASVELSYVFGAKKGDAKKLDSLSEKAAQQAAPAAKD